MKTFERILLWSIVLFTFFLAFSNSMKKSNFDSPTMSLMDLKEFVNVSPALKSSYNTLIVQKLLPGIENIIVKKYSVLSASDKQKWNQSMNTKIDEILHTISPSSTQTLPVVPSPSVVPPSTQSPLSQSVKPQTSSVVPSSTQTSSVVPSPSMAPPPSVVPSPPSTMIGSPFR